jgi:tetrahydromethanopterin:alpha-L-glutamate ligase
MHRTVVIFSDGTRQASGISLALSRAGCCTVTAALASVKFDTATPHGLSIPGLDDQLPSAVVVRSVAAGSFEAITRRLGILHALVGMGVPVWNPPVAIERCVDKSMTSFLLSRARLPTPETFCVENREQALAIVAAERARGPLVLKPLFGAQGRGIRLVREPADLPPDEEVAGVYYLQRYMARRGSSLSDDFRVFVCARVKVGGR